MPDRRRSLSFVSSDAPDAREAALYLAARYGQMRARDADVIVALGGDGFLLQTLRGTLGTGKLVYGMNRGTVGFLMNAYSEEGLNERIEAKVRSACPDTAAVILGA